MCILKRRQLTTNICALSLICLHFLAGSQSARAQTVYQTDFDNLATGLTQPFLSASGQDGFYQEITFGTSFGEIQSAVSNSGNALHEFSPAANSSGDQSQDGRPLTPTSLSAIHTFTLNFDFNARSSDLSAINPYSAFIQVAGPEGQALGIGVGGGNGQTKSSTGVNASLSTYDSAVSNDVGISLTVGQNLAFGVWHSVTLIGDFQTNHYVSLTVDGVTEALDSFVLPDSFLSGVPARPTEFSSLDLGVVANNTTFPGSATDDDIYWDNINITSTPAVTPEPGAFALGVSGLFSGTALLALRRRAARRH